MPKKRNAKQRNAWSVLGNPMFRRFWVAGAFSGTGSVIQDVTAGWLMTTLTAAPLYTALLQTASSLPVFLLALPAAPSPMSPTANG